jgi:hypothetical protein
MEQPRTSLRRSNPIGVVIAIAALIAAGFGAYRFWRQQTPPPAGSPAPTAAPVAPATGEPEAGAPVAPEQQQALLAAVSSNPLFRRALALEDFGRRCAVAIDNLREGVSPRRPLDFLAPARPFTVSRRSDGELTVAPESYGRYDAFGDAVGSVDAAALARAYRALRPALREAYRALGYPDASLDGAVVRALQRIEAAPVIDGDLPVVDAKGVYVLADAKLEGLPEVEKHLLRMGPRNTRLLQAKAREILAALDLRAAAGPQPQ